jgi:hypothetical protein
MTEPSAKVIADSLSPDGVRLTTMEVTMHRFVLAEFNTHRVFSRNSASSRAIPVAKQLERYAADPALPVEWPCEKPGMQGGDELQGQDYEDALALFREVHAATAAAVDHYLVMHPDPQHRVHKSVLNRLLEPFLWHRVIVTSTEWDNFFGLRCHPLAQPEIRAAAELMRFEYDRSKPVQLGYGGWHTPYADDPLVKDLEMRLRISVARCAWVSTMSHDGERSYDAIEKMWDRLTTAEPMHASPLEHQATPRSYLAPQVGNLRGWAQLRHMVEHKEVPW